MRKWFRDGLRRCLSDGSLQLATLMLLCVMFGYFTARL